MVKLKENTTNCCKKKTQRLRNFLSPLYCHCKLIVYTTNKTVCKAERNYALCNRQKIIISPLTPLANKMVRENV